MKKIGRIVIFVQWNGSQRKGTTATSIDAETILTPDLEAVRKT